MNKKKSWKLEEKNETKNDGKLSNKIAKNLHNDEETKS